MINRESIYAALFDLLTDGQPFVTMSRKLRHWDTVRGDEMPALFLAQAGQSFQTINGFPAKRILRATVYIYVSTKEADNPGTVLNPLVDGIDAALDLSPAGHPQRLGGLVEWARIDGDIKTSEGTLTDKEICTIPVAMLVP